MTPPGIDPGTVRLVAQRLNHYATPAPFSKKTLSNKREIRRTYLLLLLLLGTELPLVVESSGLLNDIFPFPSILDAGYPVFNLHLANILFDIILPSVLGSTLCSFGGLIQGVPGGMDKISGECSLR